MKELTQDSRYPDRGFEPGPPEYEARALTTQTRRSVIYNCSLFWLNSSLAFKLLLLYRTTGKIASMAG